MGATVRSNEYNGQKIVLRDTHNVQMSIARFFQLALVGPQGQLCEPTQGYAGGHNAWDIAPVGGLEGVIPARCPVFGTVYDAGDGYSGGMGNYVIVQENTGGQFDRWHIFMHLYDRAVNVGDAITQGQSVGTIGNTGHSFGSHLHYQVATANPSSTSRVSEDPLITFDRGALNPSWNMEDASATNNWDYIQLDDQATDYGPPGGEFFTDKCVYDVSYAQTAETVQALCDDTTTGGLILRFAWNDELDSKVTGHYAKCKAANMPVGFYSASNKNITADGESAYRAMLEAQRDLLSSTLNVTPNDCLIGVWLDLETWGNSAGSSGCGISATPNENVRQIELFREVFGTLNFPVLGFYCNYSELTSYLIGASTNEWKTYPFWYSSPGSSRATVDSEMNSFGITNAYIWQDGFPKDGDEWNYWWSPDKTYVHKQINGNWLDNDTILKPIPTSGGGGGGGGTVTSVTVSIIAPKRIYFSPNPDVFLGEDEFLNISQDITITTDAENAEIYYTVDGSSPYQYQRVVGNEEWQYTLSSHAVKYTEPVTIKTDTHFRVIAVPAGTTSAIDPLLAKGSGTFLFNFTPTQYSWESEQYAYRLSDDDNKIKFFEENRQAFLRYHAEETAEEIVYNAVVAMSEQGAGTVQPDDSAIEEGGHAGQ